jgi:hypothetical protein
VQSCEGPKIAPPSTATASAVKGAPVGLGVALGRAVAVTVPLVSDAAGSKVKTGVSITPGVTEGASVAVLDGTRVACGVQVAGSGSGVQVIVGNTSAPTWVGGG